MAARAVVRSARRSGCRRAIGKRCAWPGDSNRPIRRSRWPRDVAARPRVRPVHPAPSGAPGPPRTGTRHGGLGAASIRTAYSVLEDARTTGKSSHWPIPVAFDHATLERHVEPGFVGLLANASPRPTGSRPSSRSASPPCNIACPSSVIAGIRGRAPPVLRRAPLACQSFARPTTKYLPGRTTLRRCADSMKLLAYIVHSSAVGAGRCLTTGEGVGRRSRRAYAARAGARSPPLRYWRRAARKQGAWFVGRSWHGAKCRASGE